MRHTDEKKWFDPNTESMIIPFLLVQLVPVEHTKPTKNI